LVKESAIMKATLLAVWICLSAVSAFGQNQGGGGQGQNQGGGSGYHGAPAPLIGAGIPVAVAVGGVLLGAKLLRRKR